jgi:hypothetical protein
MSFNETGPFTAHVTFRKRHQTSMHCVINTVLFVMERCVSDTVLVIQCW